VQAFTKTDNGKSLGLIERGDIIEYMKVTSVTYRDHALLLHGSPVAIASNSITHHFTVFCGPELYQSQQNVSRLEATLGFPNELRNRASCWTEKLLFIYISLTKS